MKCNLLGWIENESCDLFGGKVLMARFTEMTSLVGGLEGASVHIILKLFHKFGRAIR